MRDRGFPRPSPPPLVLVAACLAGIALAAGVVGGIADGPPPDLFLVYTGDVIGYVDPCG